MYLQNLLNYRDFKHVYGIKWNLKIISVIPVLNVFQISFHHELIETPDNSFILQMIYSGTAVFLGLQPVTNFLSALYCFCVIISSVPEDH